MASKETETPKAAQAPATKKVTCIAPGGVHIRKDANKFAESLGVVAPGQTVEILGSRSGWLKIANGFVMAKFFE